VTEVIGSDGTDTDRSVPRWLVLLVISSVGAFLIWQLRPGLIFANTTPTGADLGYHVWAPAYLRDHLLPSLSGWSPDWFGGLPLYVFYSPIPALLILIADVVLPYGVAMKLVVALCALLLPVAAWTVAKLGRMFPLAAIAVPVAVLGFLFDDSWWRFGGNLRADLGGEFTYGLALVFLLFAIAALDEVLYTGRHRGAAALLGSLTLVSHPVLAIVLIIAAGLLIFSHGLLRGWNVVPRILPVAGVALLLSSFWVVPFLFYRSEFDPLHPPKVTTWVELFFPLPFWAELVVIPLAVFAVIRGVARRNPMTVALGGLAVCAGLLVLATGSAVVENARFIPIYHVARWMLAGIGFAEVVALVAERRARAAIVLPCAGLAVMIFSLGVITGSLPLSRTRIVTTPAGLVSKTKWLFLPETETNINPLWVRVGFGGVERAPLWPEYQALIDNLKAVGHHQGCGRLVAENQPSTSHVGQREISMLPYWTDGCIGAMIGVPPEESRTEPLAQFATSEASAYVESSDLTKLQSHDFTAGAQMLRDMGVRYYIAWSQPAIEAAGGLPFMHVIGSSGPWTIYQLDDANVVHPLEQDPVRFPHMGEEQWRELVERWFVAGMPGGQPVEGGSKDWSEWTQSGQGAASESSALTPVSVSRVKIARNRISFHVDRIGQPIAIRNSYFPWWSVTGASGPWRLAPNSMVVVPTSNDVTLVAKRRWPDHLAVIVSVIGLVALAALVLHDRRTPESTQ
jgi:hypothetical protein